MSDTREQSREVELTPQRKAYLWLKHNYRRPPLPVQGDCCEYDVRLDRMPQVLAEYADAELTALRSQLATVTREREEWESRRDRLLIDLGMSAKLLAAAEQRASAAEAKCGQLEAALKEISQIANDSGPMNASENFSEIINTAARVLAGKE